MAYTRRGPTPVAGRLVGVFPHGLHPPGADPADVTVSAASGGGDGVLEQAEMGLDPGERACVIYR